MRIHYTSRADQSQPVNSHWPNTREMYVILDSWRPHLSRVFIIYYWRFWKAWNGYPLTALSLPSEAADIIWKVVRLSSSGYYSRYSVFNFPLTFLFEPVFSLLALFFPSYASSLVPPFCWNSLYWWFSQISDWTFFSTFPLHVASQMIHLVLKNCSSIFVPILGSLNTVS